MTGRPARRFDPALRFQQRAGGAWTVYRPFQLPVSIDLNLPVGTFLRLSVSEYRKTLNGAELSPQMLDEALEKAANAWMAHRKPKRKPKIKDEGEWLAALKADPFLKGVNFDKELAACQYWCRNKLKVCSRQRVENWMKRAALDSKVDNRGGDDSSGGAASHAPKPNPGPPGWLAWARENIPGWRRFSQEAQGSPIPEWHLLDSTERQAIASQMPRAS